MWISYVKGCFPLLNVQVTLPHEMSASFCREHLLERRWTPKHWQCPSYFISWNVSIFCREHFLERHCTPKCCYCAWVLYTHLHVGNVFVEQWGSSTQWQLFFLSKPQQITSITNVISPFLPASEIQPELQLPVYGFHISMLGLNFCLY